MRTLTRSQAIEDLRRELLKLVGPERSLCLVAARRGILCGGFERWSKEELERRFPSLLLGGVELTRDELERRANLLQLAKQDLTTGRLPCDRDGDSCSLPCTGWNEFRDTDLAQFHLEMCGEEVQVVPDPPAEAERLG